MTYGLQIESRVDKAFVRLARRDPARYALLKRKIAAIQENPFAFKPLKGDLHGARRVHIGGSFVLIYEIDTAMCVVRLIDYDRHDNIYER